MKISELKTAGEVREEQIRRDPEFRREWERTAFARDVAIRIVRYRTENKLTQAALARKIGTTQSVIARLESGDHAPSILTLAKLSAATDVDFDIRVSHGSVELVG